MGDNAALFAQIDKWRFSPRPAIVGAMPKTFTTKQHSVKRAVFWPALAIIVIVVLICITFPNEAGEFLDSLLSGTVSSLGWYLTLCVAGFLIFCVFMVFSRFGKIKLGPDDEGATYGFPVWFSMLFAAGMGIGLVFWGAAEPLSHYLQPKPGSEGESSGVLAADAMTQTFVNWGFNAWAIYGVVGLAMAYAIHKKNRPVSIRWTLEPIFGDRVKGWVGDVIDVVAIVGTVAGVATSLGLGVTQISSGLVHLGFIEEATNPMLVALIIVITAFATFSVVSGVDKGIKYFSNFNLGLAGVFAISILILGPTLFILRGFVESAGGYLFELVPLSTNTSAFEGEAGQLWQATWPVFYWGWWISWAPFVGIFIARISRGRTVREFMVGVLCVPTLVSVIWFSILGGAALFQQMAHQAGDGVPSLAEPDGTIDSSAVLFNLLEGFPMGTLLAGVAIVLVAIFFITSSDSGSLVVDMLASGGDPDPPTWSRVLWSVIEGLVAVALLLAGGLAALQTGAILVSVPFSVIMVLMCFATYKTLKNDSSLKVNLETSKDFQPAEK